MFKRKVPSGPIEKGRREEDKSSQAAPRPEKPSAEHSIIPIKGSVKAETVRVCGTFDGKVEFD